MHLGATLMAVGDFTEAVDALRSSVSLEPRNLEAAMLLAQALEHEMLFGELTELSAHLLEAYPTQSNVKALAEHVAAASQTMPLPAARMATALPGAVTPSVGLPAGVTKLRP
jgi:predicted Zn-dependent protease